MDAKTKTVVNNFCRTHYDIPQMHQLVIEFGNLIPDSCYCTRVRYSEGRERIAHEESWSDKITKHLLITVSNGSEHIDFSLLDGNLKSVGMFEEGCIEKSFGKYCSPESKKLSDKLSDKLGNQ